MIAATQLKASTTVRLRPIALPAEHGGWSLLLEPIVLGLVLIPSVGGLWVSFTAISAFLMRHPFKLAVVDWRRKRRYGRTPLAARFALLYFVVAIVSFVSALKA
ncbi:MAG TPA: YwiC-like family protein, partial [Pyrinomonadaceae bacterium]